MESGNLLEGASVSVCILLEVEKIISLLRSEVPRRAPTSYCELDMATTFLPLSFHASFSLRPSQALAQDICRSTIY